MGLRIATKKRKPKVEYKTGVNKTGLVYAEIELTSFDDIALHRRGFLDEEKIKRVKVSSLVDTGAYMLTISDNIRNQLDFH